MVNEHNEACLKEHLQLMRNELAHTKEEILILDLKKLQVGEEKYHKSLTLKQHFFEPDKNHNHEGPHIIIKQKSVEYKKNMCLLTIYQ